MNRRRFVVRSAAPAEGTPGISRRDVLLAAGWTIAGAVIPGSCVQSTPSDGALPDALLTGFHAPPQQARPRVWWHWIGGNVSLDGARLDLQWMERVGIGGVHAFSGGGLPGPVVVAKPLPFMSDGWREALRESARMARDAGMEFGIAGSPGWSQTGGVWVEPRDAMKKYVWSETIVQGGKPVRGVLRQPPTATGSFQGKQASGRMPVQLKSNVYAEAFVIAYPTPAAERAIVAPTFTSSAGPIDMRPLALGDLSTSIALPATDAGNGAWIEAVFVAPTRVRAVSLGLPSGAAVEVQVSDDGVHFRTIARTVIEGGAAIDHPAPQQTLALPPTVGRHFRIALTMLPPQPPLPGMPPNMGSAMAPQTQLAFPINQLVFHTGARVHLFEAKAGFQSSLPMQDIATPSVSPDAVVKQTTVIDITSRLRSDGHLDWTPPAGHWTVLRFGWSLTGQTNGPAEPQATGLEVDKLDPDAVRRYLDSYLKLYRDATGREPGPEGVQALLTDSWEAGVQNWTPKLLDEFRTRRGYEPTPFLPVLAGRVVEDAATSDRFLWDFRQTLQEMLADNHHGVLAQALRERGMVYYTEAQGDTPRAIADGMTLKARSDIPTAEFWYRPFAAGPGQPSLRADLEEAASAAHVYGKPLAAAEALTVAAGSDPWAFSPAMLKPVADEIFARGINRLLIHDSHHQPLADAKPGLMMFIFGQFFNRNDTWSQHAGAWVSYLSRTSYLLQQGRYVADVAYFYGQERNLTELFRERFNTDVPEGYRYDYINPEALLTLLSVQDGRIVTPSGMQYRVLFMPRHVTRLTLPVLRKLRDLLAAGAVIVGPKPLAGLGLSSPDSDVCRLADELWGAAVPAAVRSYGKGRIYGDLPAALDSERIVPDVIFANRAVEAPLLFVHRRTEDTDIYFISNQAGRAQSVEATFRVVGKVPEIWRAETGTSEPVSYWQRSGGVAAALDLQPHEAVFVVFRRATQAQSWQAPRLQNTVLATLEGSWSVSFQADRGAPAAVTFDRLISWPEASDPGIRYFSGAAVYRKTVRAKSSWFGRGKRVVLDLGEVHELAVVSVNGKRVAISWHAPHRVDLTDALRFGSNRLEIEVVNLWPNRLIGDRRPGATPIAFAPQSPYTADSPLLASGLLGPVRLIGFAPLPGLTR